MISEGLRMFKRHLRVRGKRYTRLGDSAEEICEETLRRLWDGTIMRTSLGNYPQFYARDLGMYLPSLLKLGKHEEARKTMRYALSRYARRGRITSQITPRGTPMNFPPVFSPDSTAYVLRSVRLLGDKELLEEHKAFLAKAARTFAHKALDKKGKVKRRKHLGGMRDHAIRDASCYDTVMAAVVQQECALLGIKYKHSGVDYKRILLKEYWTGEYFRDDKRTRKITADANIYPFWLGIINDKEKLRKAIQSMRQAGLDKPFPVKYVRNKEEQGHTVWQRIFAPDWEADSAWPMSGLPFIDLVARVNKKQAAFYHDQYRRLMEEYGTFVEVYGRDGKPYHSWFFSADEGMIWCSLWLEQKKRL